MKTSEMIALGLAGVALYFIVTRQGVGGVKATNPASGPMPLYWVDSFGSEGWSQSSNNAANARLQRQGSI